MSERAPPPENPEVRKNGRDADRLAEALRANLARRKAQKRARAKPGQDDKKQG